MDVNFRHLLRAIYADEPNAAELWGGEIGEADLVIMAELYLSERCSYLHRLIEAAVGGGMPVDVPAYVEAEHGGDWSKAVAFACEAIAVHQNRKPRPAEKRGTTVSDPDRRGF